MKRIVKIGFPILCVAIVGGTFAGLHKTQKTIDELQEYSNSVNEISNNTVQNSYIENEENTSNSSNNSSTNNVTNSNNSVNNITNSSGNTNTNSANNSSN